MASPVSILENLSAEVRERLLGRLELHPARKAIEIVNQPPLDAFGLRTHETTLRRFAARYLANDGRENLGVARLFLLKNALGTPPFPFAFRTSAFAPFICQPSDALFCALAKQPFCRSPFAFRICRPFPRPLRNSLLHQSAVIASFCAPAQVEIDENTVQNTDETQFFGPKTHLTQINTAKILPH